MRISALAFSGVAFAAASVYLGVVLGLRGGWSLSEPNTDYALIRGGATGLCLLAVIVVFRHLAFQKLMLICSAWALLSFLIFYFYVAASSVV